MHILKANDIITWPQPEIDTNINNPKKINECVIVIEIKTQKTKQYGMRRFK